MKTVLTAVVLLALAAAPSAQQWTNTIPEPELAGCKPPRPHSIILVMDSGFRVLDSGDLLPGLVHPYSRNGLPYYQGDLFLGSSLCQCKSDGASNSPCLTQPSDPSFEECNAHHRQSCNPAAPPADPAIAFTPDDGLEVASWSYAPELCPFPDVVKVDFVAHYYNLSRPAAKLSVKLAAASGAQQRLVRSWSSLPVPLVTTGPGSRSFSFCLPSGRFFVDLSAEDAPCSGADRSFGETENYRLEIGPGTGPELSLLTFAELMCQ